MLERKTESLLVSRKEVNREINAKKLVYVVLSSPKYKTKS
jgi:hypothetical protein